jgi:hypothetical protein
LEYGGEKTYRPLYGYCKKQMRSITFDKIFHSVLAVIATFICFAPKSIGLLIAILAAVIVYGYVKKHFSFKLYWPHILLALLYMSYFIGAFYTNNPKIANMYLENKLSFLIFPLLFSFKPNFTFKLDLPFLGLIAGVVITAIMGLFNSFFVFAENGSLFSSFTGVYFSHIHHPSYFAIYVLCAVYGAWYFYLKGSQLYFKKWVLPFSLFGILAFGLCLSMAGFIFLFIFMSFVSLKWIYTKVNRFLFYGLVILSPIIILFTLSVTPGFKDDFAHTQNSVNNYFNDPSAFVKAKVGYKTGNEARLIMWTVTWDEIKKNPFGVGTGNVDESLSKRLVEYNQFEYAKKDDNGAIQYNPHNQFLQTTLEIGLTGLIILLTFITLSLKLAFRYENHLFTILILSLVFNSLFESILQRQSGIVFFSFWICLFVVYLNQSNPKKSLS